MQLVFLFRIKACISSVDRQRIVKISPTFNSKAIISQTG